MRPKLSIGMAHFDDFHGAYFTLSSLRLHHAEAVRHCELIVVDNNPSSAHGEALRGLAGWCKDVPFKYVPFTEVTGTAATRDLIFTAASGEFVLVMDPHVLLAPGSLERLLSFYAVNPTTTDLYQGPMLYDDLKNCAAAFNGDWGAGMWGQWVQDARADDPNGPPFEIPAMGLGLYTCRRDAWLGFNPAFRQFGGEEWYIHEKYRKAGRRTWCLPFLRWLHRFGRPDGVRYPLTNFHKCRNYVIGHRELGLDLAPVEANFVGAGLVSKAEWEAILNGASEPPAAAPAPACAPCGQPAAPASLDAAYSLAANTPSDINEHVPTLKELAAKCEVVVEFGVRTGVSTAGLLAGRPKRLLSIDLNDSPQARALAAVADGTEFEFRRGDSRTAEIPEADLVFIDTVHSADHVYAELSKHAPKARRWVAFHDTEIYGEQGEDGGPGLLPAIRRFLKEHPEWSVIRHDANNHGFTVISRDPADKPELPSAARQAWNFARAMARHVAGGLKVLPDERVQARLDQCSLCPLRNGDRCSKCGCYLTERPDGGAGKALLPGEFCPLGHWHAEAPGA